MAKDREIERADGPLARPPLGTGSRFSFEIGWLVIWAHLNNVSPFEICNLLILVGYPKQIEPTLTL